MTSEPVIRQMEFNDLDGVMRVEHKSFTLPWTKGMFEDELYNPQAHYLVLEVSGEIAGYAGYWKILDEGHITNVAIHSDYRRLGYGRRLIQALIEQAKAMDIVAMTLEVRVSNNPAISLYQSFGFQTEGIRKRYYTDNQEDAAIMWLIF